MTTTTDNDTIQALRQDLALQLTRAARRGGLSQLDTAQRWGIPQPTLSQIMAGRVTGLSLELLLRVAVRAQLPVTLQTGLAPAEAGVFVPAPEKSGRTHRSRLSDASRAALSLDVARLTPTERLAAQLAHCQQVTALHRAGRARRDTPTRARTP